jgi:hypothetical protein
MTGISICLAIVAVLALVVAADALRAPPVPPKLARGLPRPADRYSVAADRGNGGAAVAGSAMSRHLIRTPENTRTSG